MASPALKIALVAINQPGYGSLALGNLHAFAEAHERLRGRVAYQALDLDTTIDPWLIAYRVLRMQPDVVAFSTTCWNATAVYEACRVIRSADRRIRTILGGPEVGPIAEEILTENPSVDIVIRGEGEETFAEVLQVVMTGKRPWMCKGVTGRDGDRIVSAPDRPLIEDLDSIPSPYLTGILTPDAGNSYIETYRGCPHRCGYCYEAKGTSRIRSFSKERVKAEIDALASTPGVRSFSFVDSVFNLTNDRLAWLTEILEPHARRGLRLHTVEVDIERIGDAEADQLRRAGVVSVETGPQTIGTEALAACRRSFQPERFVAGVEALRRVGISVTCDLIIGLPGDDAFDVLASLRWALELDPGAIQSSTLRVLPGTDFAQRADQHGLAYNVKPDHEVIQTKTLPFAHLRRLEILGEATRRSYRARL